MNVKNDKPWRFHSESEFKKALDELLERELEHYDEYLNKVKGISLSYSREDADLIKDHFSKMKNQNFADNNRKYQSRNRISEEPYSSRVQSKNYHMEEINKILSSLSYEESHDELLERELDQYLERKRKLKTKLLSSNVELWTETSINPTSARDVMIKLIAGKRYDLSLVCISYIMKSSIMTEELIKDIIFVTSPLFSFDTWDDSSVETVCNLTIKWIASGKGNAYHLIKELAKEDFSMYDSLKQIIDRGQKDMENRIKHREEEIQRQQQIIRSINEKIEVLENQFNTIKLFVINHAPQEGWTIQKYFDIFDKLVEEIQKKHHDFQEEDWDKRRKVFRKREKKWSDQTFMSELWSKWDAIPRKMRIEISNLQRECEKAKKLIEKQVNLIEETRKSGIQIEFSDRIDWNEINKDILSDEFKKQFSPILSQSYGIPYKNRIFE